MAALRFPPPFQPEKMAWVAATQIRVRRPAVRASTVTGYSLTVVDVRDGSLLVVLPSSNSWPACPTLSDISAANPAWRGVPSPQDAASLLREEIAMLDVDGRSIVWRESFSTFSTISGPALRLPFHADRWPRLCRREASVVSKNQLPGR